MGRVMIVGYGPLPRAGLTYMAAPALRTRHFLKPILDAGHTVNLYTLPLKTPPGPEGEMSAMVPDSYEGLSCQRFTNHDGEFAVAQLTEQARQIKPDAIVGVNTFPSFVASRLPVRVPLWVDLNGFWMAEMQGKCRTEGSDHWLSYAWTVERTIVRRLDKFSAVSRPQLHAVLGELGSVGRLNQYTFDYPFGHHIPNAAYHWDAGAGKDAPAADPILRGPIVPTDAFVVLWSGGFNVWADIETLVETMNLLMARYPLVHFVATGGRIAGHVSRPYEEFEERVGASPYKDRFHLLGWVESEKLPAIYREADLGINVDAQNYETLFGARNRHQRDGRDGAGRGDDRRHRGQRMARRSQGRALGAHRRPQGPGRGHRAVDRAARGSAHVRPQRAAHHETRFLLQAHHAQADRLAQRSAIRPRQPGQDRARRR